jgi:hypothetical protein
VKIAICATALVAEALVRAALLARRSHRPFSSSKETYLSAYLLASPTMKQSWPSFMSGS